MILGIDPGERRIGVAGADVQTRFAHPVEVIDVQRVDPVTRIAELAEELQVETIVVGRPVSLSGAGGAAVDAQQQLVARLRRELPVEVIEFDERLTTVIAERSLRAAGTSAPARKARRDAIAAQVMLQDYLDSMR